MITRPYHELHSGVIELNQPACVHNLTLTHILIASEALVGILVNTLMLLSLSLAL